MSVDMLFSGHVLIERSGKQHHALSRRMLLYSSCPGSQALNNISALSSAVFSESWVHRLYFRFLFVLGQHTETYSLYFDRFSVFLQVSICH